jgi:hypothetical protein
VLGSLPPQQISNARNDCCRRRDDTQAKGEGWRCGRLRRGVGGFGPTGTKSRRGGGEGRAGLVKRSSEFGAADARPKRRRIGAAVGGVAVTGVSTTVEVARVTSAVQGVDGRSGRGGVVRVAGVAARERDGV